jgi:transcriptional regulator with XRE-family HTH domain
VTIGAVSKWENGGNVPDITTLMELANLFNVSMDELVGFDLTSKKMDDMCMSIEKLTHAHQFERAEEESGSALLRYPHAFKVLYTCGNMYYYKYMKYLKEKDSERAIDLFQTSLNYIAQNHDAEINEYTIKFKVAFLYRRTNPEKALELLREINYDNCNDNAIGVVLRQMGRTKDALHHFSIAHMRCFSEQQAIVYNLASTLCETGKCANLEKALELVDAEITIVKLHMQADKISFYQEIQAVLLITKAQVLSCLEDLESMENCIKEAYRFIKQYDETEKKCSFTQVYKFDFTNGEVPIHNAIGEKALEGIEEMFFRNMERKKKPLQRVWDCWQMIKNQEEGK